MPDVGDGHLTLGPWEGLNELASKPGEVVGCLNVDFEDGWIRRRLGRRVIATPVGRALPSRSAREPLCNRNNAFKNWSRP